jgi:outer membrane protein assembly factor BamB
MNNDKVIRWGLSIIAVLIVIAFLLRRSSTGPGGHGSTASFPERWQFTATGAITGALALSADGTLYASSADGFVSAVDASGNLQWKFETGPLEAGPTIGPDGTIYVSNNEERIFALNRNGTQQWAVGGGPFADKNVGKTAAAVDQTFLYTPWRGQIRAVRLTNGAFDWAGGIGFGDNCVVTILPGGLIVYPGAGRLDAVDSNGRTEWEYPVQNPPPTVDSILKNRGRPVTGNFWLQSGIAVAADSTLYGGADNSRIVAFTPSGAFKWDFRARSAFHNGASPVIATDGTIYFASGDGSVYALDSDGTQKWSLQTGGAIEDTPMLAEDGTLYAVLAGGLIVVSPDGKLLAKTDISGGVGASPTLGPDGTIYVGSRSGKIFAFSGTHGGLMKSPWPKFQHDLSNSGRANPL